MAKEILFSIYGSSSFDMDSEHYGPAITTSFEEDGQIWVTNGEYISRVNYCPYTGKKASSQMPMRADNAHPPQAA